MSKLDKTIIVFTGPESTGKSTISEQMSNCYGGLLIPEYARTYTENLKGPYTYDDVIAIANKQVDQFNEAIKSRHKYIFFDTFLIITKVWFREVYGVVPDWLSRFLGEVNIDLHLLFEPDIKWVKDSVRENEHRRHELFKIYENELINYGFVYKTINGNNDKRVTKTQAYINQVINP